MAPPVLLLRVASAWALPGLGLLALPEAGPTPLLAQYPLHTAVAVVARLADGSRHEAVGTVEEISRPGAAPTTALLLDFGRPVALAAGTEIWLQDNSDALPAALR